MEAGEKANDSGGDVMMESTTSDSGNQPDSGMGSETSSIHKIERERRESTSSNPSDVIMMPPSPVSREQVRIYTVKFQKLCIFNLDPHFVKEFYQKRKSNN